MLAVFLDAQNKIIQFIYSGNCLINSLLVLCPESALILEHQKDLSVVQKLLEACSKLPTTIIMSSQKS